MENKEKTYNPPKQERDYTHTEASLMILSDKNLQLLEQLLQSTIESEKEVSRIYRLTRPDAQPFNDCYRIKNIIDKYKKAWEVEVTNEDDDQKPSLIAHLAPVRGLK